MKLKYYMRGVGIGIIFTTLLFLIAVMPNKAKMSEEEIILEAKKLGMVEQEESTKGLSSLLGPSQKPDGVSGQAAVTQPGQIEEPSSPPKVSANITVTPSVTKQPDATPSLTSPSEKEKPKPTETIEYISLTIKPGMHSEDIAELAEQNGLIKNGSKFNKFLSENQYSDYILTGTFQIPRNADYEEIAKIITRSR